MTPEQTLDWLAQQHFNQCREDRPVQHWIRKMKSELPEQEPECARCKDLEEQAYDLLGQLKVANLKWSVAHPWVGLTDEELDAEACTEEPEYSFVQGALWAEAKLKEKNT
jgi:hypothetical protein